MRKLAIFVEGQTELIFIDRLLREISGRRGLLIEHSEAQGGGRGARRLRLVKQVAPKPHHEFYVMIVNCGSDSRVKSDIHERYEGLVRAGYERIIGIRDVYRDFEHSQILKLRAMMQWGMRTEPIRVRFILSVMEIEAWFLAEHTHLMKINPLLTPQTIREQFGFDPQLDDLERRPHPAEDLDRIYRFGGAAYAKHRNHVQRTVDLLDYERIYCELGVRFVDFANLLAALSEFFEERGEAATM
jgi:hypothetical protein